MMKLSFDRLTNALVANFRNTLNKFIGEVEENFTETVGDLNKAKADASAAVAKADEAKGKAESVQAQLDSIVADAGNSNTEIVQARVDTDGNAFGTIKQRIDSEANKIEVLSEIKATQLNTLKDLKNYSATLGEVIETKGYYTVGDKGHGKYVVVNTGTPDDGYIIALNNGLKAQLIHGGTIYARQYGVKLDDATDDTARLNAFFKMFGQAKLVINDGIAVTTAPLIVKGRWREDSPTVYNNSIRKLVFDQATIRYTGTADKCAIMFWNHFTSYIEGLAISRSSNKCYVDMTMVWNSEFTNFDIPMLCMNRDTSIITETIADRSVHTTKFSRGYIAGYNLRMDATNTWINSIHFDTVNFFSNKTTYCVEFYGTSSFQNITFNKCDLSYATKSIFYIDQTIANSCAIKLASCYLDSVIPYTEDSNLKGFKLDVQNVIEAQSNSATRDIIYTKDFMKTYRTGSFGANTDSVPTMNMNLCKNGDFYCTNPLASPGWISNNVSSTYTFKAGNASLSGNILVAEYSANVTNYFYGIPAPITASYVAGVRFKLISGTGTIKLGFGATAAYRTVDLSKITVGEEILVTTNGFANTTYTEGANMSLIFDLSNKGAENVVLEISEVFIVAGVQARAMLPLHPKAQVFRTNKGTVTYNGDGAFTSKTISHGLYATPSYFHVERVSADAGTAGIKYVTADANNLTVYFNTAPISGTSNVVLKWKAEV